MAYTVSLPDGREVEFPDTVSHEQAASIIREQLGGGKKTGVLAALGKGTEGVISSTKTAMQSMFGDATEAGKQGLDRAAKSEYADQIGFDKLKEVYAQKGLLSAAGEVGRQIPLAIAEQAPNLAASLAAARLGAAVGSVVPGLGTGVGALVGGGIGAFAPSLLQQMGGNVQRQVQETGAADAGKAAAAAVPQALLDVAGNYIPLGKTVIGKMLGPEVTALLNKGSKEAAEKLAKESLTKAVVKGTAIGAVAEIPTEVTQSAIERLQAGLPLLTEDAFKEYGETAYQAALLAPVGGAGRLMDRSAAREPAPAAPGEAPPMAPVDVARAARESAKAEAAAKAGLLSENDLYELANGPYGQAEVAKYKAGLASQPQTSQVKAAEEQATKLLELLAAEEYSGILRNKLDAIKSAKERGLPTAETSAFNAPAETETAPTEDPTPEAIPEPKVRKKGAKNVAVPPVVGPGETTAIEPNGVGTVVPSVGVDSGANAGTAAVQPETPGVGVSELPTTSGNAPEGITGSTVDVGGVPFTITAHTDSMLSMRGEDGSVKRVMRSGKLGRAIEAQLGISTVAEETPTVEAAPPEETNAAVETPAVTPTTVAAPEGIEAPTEVPAGPFAALSKEVPALEAVEAPLEPTESVESLIEQRDSLKQAIAEDKKSQAALRTPGGALLPTKQAGYDELQNSIDQTQQKLDAIQEQIKLAKKAKGREIAPEQAGQIARNKEWFKEEGQREKPEGAKELIQQIIEAVGAYNNPTSDVKRRYVATDFLYSIATEPNQKPSVKQFALRALRNAVDPMDMRPSLRAKYDELVRNVEEDTTDWGGYRYNVQALNDAVPTSEEFKTAVENGRTRKALQIVLNHPQSDNITKLVIRSILKADTLPKLSVAPSGTFGVDPKTGEDRVGIYDSVEDAIGLDERYVTAANLIHEVMHGFLHRKLEDAVRGGHKDAQVQRLGDLYLYLKNNHPELAESYGMVSLSEFASEVMSNGSFQDKLKDIPYKKSNVFREFAKAVLKLLGINDTTPKWNALAEALISTEAIMQSGRLLQEVRTGTPGPGSVSNITPNAVAAAAQADIIGEDVEPTKLQKLKKWKDTKLTRTAIVDVTSSVIDKIFTGYAGRMRDATGEIIPTEHIAQALDATRIAERSLVEGGVGLTRDGLFTAVSLGKLPTGEEISAKGINSIITKDAKRAGLTFEGAMKVFDTQLAAHREHEMDIYNNLPTTKVPIELRIDPAARQANEVEFQNNPEAQKVAKIMDIMRFNRIDALVIAGRISPAKAQLWKDVTGYVPFQSMDALIDKMNQSTYSTGKGLGAKTTYFKIEGGTDQLASIVGAFQIKMANMVVDAIKTNAVSKASQALELLGHAKRVNPQASITKDEESRSQVTYVNGAPQRFIYNDPLDAAAFASMPNTVSSAVDLLQTMSRVLRTSVTWGFKFAVGQVIQDVTRAYAMSDVNRPAVLIPRILLNFPRAVFGELTGNKTAAQRALENAGVMSTVDTGVRGTVKSIQIEIGAKNRNALDMFFHVMESIAKGSDAAVRQAIYQQSMKETNDEALSLSRAREVINFSRRGNSRIVDILVRTVPFTNAYIRGMDKLYDTARLTTTGKGSVYNMTPSKARRMFATRALTIAGTWAVYSMMMSDDEEYQALDDNVRDSTIVLPFIRVGDSPLAIPLPRDIAYIYKAIPERLIAYYNKYGTDEEQSILRVTGELLKQGGDTLLSPSVIPSAIVPFAETLTNYSFFLGRDLESTAQRRQLPEERFGRGTSELAKEAGQMLGLSPIKIDNFVRGLFGTMGALVLGITDKIIDPERTEKADKSDLLVQLTGLSNLMIDPVGRKQLNALYKLEDRVTQVHNSLKKKELKSPQEAAEFATENEKYLRVYEHTQQVFKQVQDLNAQIKLIDADKRLTPTERQKAIAMVVREQNDIAKQVTDIQAYLDRN